MDTISDKDRLDFIHELARRSSTGVSIDWVGSFGNERSGYRLLSRHRISGPFETARDAIDDGIYNRHSLLP